MIFLEEFKRSEALKQRDRENKNNNWFKEFPPFTFTISYFMNTKHYTRIVQWLCNEYFLCIGLYKYNAMWCCIAPRFLSQWILKYQVLSCRAGKSTKLSQMSKTRKTIESLCPLGIERHPPYFHSQRHIDGTSCERGCP